jgi:hypothetical protein
MKYLLITLLISTLCLLACGNGGQSENDSVDRSEAYEKAEQERFEEYGYEPAPEQKKGPQIPVDELEPGTCAYAAGKFSQALAAVDSTEAMKYCTDTTKLILRAMFSNAAQIENLKRIRDKGMYIKSAAVERYSRDSSVCHACVTAVLDSVPDESCGFMLRQFNGEWKIFQLGE